MCLFIFFFFNDTATTEIYTLSLHDALPICLRQRNGLWIPENSVHPVLVVQVRSGRQARHSDVGDDRPLGHVLPDPRGRDRKSTRLNSSHSQISYAVFCLKKKKRIDIYSMTT